MTNGAVWFRRGEWPIWSFDPRAAEWRRLEAAAAAAGVAITPLAVAAHVLVDHTECDLREAWDRLAFHLERMHRGQWPPQRLDIRGVAHHLTTRERVSC